MAVRSVAITDVERADLAYANADAIMVEWTTLANGDTGAWFKTFNYRVRSVLAKGTFGAGGTVVLEGSNDGGTTQDTLLDEDAAAVSLTAAGHATVRDQLREIRPNVTGGDGTTSLTVRVWMTRCG